MRAITVRQPWAWAIMHGGKDVENRSRNIAGAYRGPVAIHAGLRVDEGWPLTAKGSLINDPAPTSTSTAAFGAFGAILGVVDLTDVCSGGWDWMATYPPGGGLPKFDLDCRHRENAWALHDHYHLTLANPRPLTTPIPAKGRLGLWTLPDDIAARVEELAQ